MTAFFLAIQAVDVKAFDWEPAGDINESPNSPFLHFSMEVHPTAYQIFSMTQSKNLLMTLWMKVAGADSVT